MLISWLGILGAGFVVTVELSALTLVFAVVIAGVVALMSISPWWPVRGLAGVSQADIAIEPGRSEK